MEGRRCRQEEVDVQASPRRQLPRRLAVQCRRRGLECRKSAQAGRTAVRSKPGRRHRIADADARLGAQDRRHDAGIDHQGAGQLPADQPHQSVHGEPREMAKAVRRGGRRGCKNKIPGRMGRVREGRLGHRPLENVELHAARAARACQERELLGQGTRSQGRQDAAAAADARGPMPAPRHCSPGQVDWIEAPAPDAVRGNQAARLQALQQ